MCNAWNHRQPCNCGWGQGSGGYWDRSINPLHPVIGHFRSASGYVNPNAICPVCHEQVFFVQCGNGGRVFFDELGPPWPKHPCTDNGEVPRKANQLASIRKAPQWREELWTPFLVDGIAKRHDVSEVSGYVNGIRVNLFLPLTWKHLDALFQIRVPRCVMLNSISSPDEYPISILVLTDNVRVVETNGFTSESAAERARISAIKNHQFRVSGQAKKASYGSNFARGSARNKLRTIKQRSITASTNPMDVRGLGNVQKAKREKPKQRNSKLIKNRESTTWVEPESSPISAIEQAFIDAGLKQIK